ncbi:MAG: hypothetical protein CR991_10590 [Proteobacteria bacterium]|nr:MAG: hypothetical protein CR991_10590 [Pseudomonadota bacterium]
MLGSLFKPKWQHKDAKVRIQAISSLEGNSRELIQLAQNDPNTGVRLEAITALTDIPSLIQLGKRSDELGERARLRVVALALNSQQQDTLLIEVFTWLQSNPNLMNALARDVERDIALRRLALEQVSDEKLLFAIADQDVSREIQFLAASRLTQADLLRQLEKTHGKSNKRLRQLLKERLSQEQLRQERQQTLISLCEAMASLGLSGQWAQDKTRQRILLQSWKQQQAQAAIDAALEKRFQDAEKEFIARLDKHEADLAAQAPLRAVFEQCLSDVASLQNALQYPDANLSLDKVDEQIQSLQQRWEQAETLPDSVQAELDKAWENQLTKLQETRSHLAEDWVTLIELQRCCQTAEAMRDNSKPLQSAKLTELQANWIKIKRPLQLRELVTAWEARFHQTMNSLNARLQREASQRERLLKDIQADLDQMEADLQAEKYGEAIDLHRKVSQLVQDHTDLPHREVAAIKRRLQAATPLVMEFKDWRRWGTDQAREHLIETAERLERDETLDPQVRAKEIKALREEWRKLAQMEPGQQHKQWKTFDSKVTAAYELSRQYFTEQASQREAHLQEREQICSKLEALKAETNWEAVEDWHAIYVAMNRQRKAWKQAGTVSHKAWKKVNERFNSAMDALETYLAVERKRNWAERHDLLKRAATLLEWEDMVEAAEAAKALQAEWQITVPSRPKEEQKLWKQFRAPIDEIFERLKENRKVQRSETEEKIAHKEQLLADMEAWLSLSGQDFMQAAKETNHLRQQFNEIRGLPKAAQQRLEERWRKLEQSLRQKQAQVHWQLQLAELDSLAEQSQARQQSSEVLEPSLLDQAQQQGESLLLQLETLLELPSPEAFQQARMEYQIAHMSEAMRSRSSEEEKRVQALGLLKQWYGLSALSAMAWDAQQERIIAIRQGLTGA